MHPTSTFRHPPGATLAIAAAVSTVIALGLVASVTLLFQSRGEPLGELAAAERACTAQRYVSDREACMRAWIAARHGTEVAARAPAR